MAFYNFVPLLNSHVLKCKACFKKFMCVRYGMCSLVMSPFSRDFIKNGNTLIIKFTVSAAF